MGCKCARTQRVRGGSSWEITAYRYMTDRLYKNRFRLCFDHRVFHVVKIFSLILPSVAFHRSQNGSNKFLSLASIRFSEMGNSLRSFCSTRHILPLRTMKNQNNVKNKPWSRFPLLPASTLLNCVELSVFDYYYYDVAPFPPHKTFSVSRNGRKNSISATWDTPTSTHRNISTWKQRQTSNAHVKW